VRRHGHLAPIAGTACNDFTRKGINNGGLLVGVALGHLLIRRANRFLIHFMAGQAVGLGNQFHPFFYIGIRRLLCRRRIGGLCAGTRIVPVLVLFASDASSLPQLVINAAAVKSMNSFFMLNCIRFLIL
jgi:hypothetical protein